MEPIQPTQPTPQQPIQGQSISGAPIQDAQPAAAVPQYTQQPTPQQPFAPQNPNMTPPQLPKKSKKTLIIIVAIVVLLIIAALGVIVLTKDKDSSTNSTTSTPTTTEEKLKIAEEKLDSIQSAADKNAQDLWTRAGINSIHGKLEEYYNENNGYPATFNTSSDATFKGIDTNAFTDKLGKKIAIEKAVKDKAAADAVPTPTAAGPHMQYIPYLCDATTCQKYILRGFIASSGAGFTNPYVKNSLN